MSASLVGSEMCIRDRWKLVAPAQACGPAVKADAPAAAWGAPARIMPDVCLLYTSDAADDM
eukprot:5106312-Alexandrium_andersonii.AAC.1